MPLNPILMCHSWPVIFSLANQFVWLSNSLESQNTYGDNDGKAFSKAFTRELSKDSRRAFIKAGLAAPGQLGQDQDDSGDTSSESQDIVNESSKSRSMKPRIVTMKV